jgi:uncharacterized protein YbcI
VQARDSDTATLERELGTELLQIHEGCYGKSAGSTKVVVADDTIVVFLDDLELQLNEQFLVDAGVPRAVVEQRARFQEAIETSYRAAVERVTGRTVISFASATKLDPNYAVEIFRLAHPDCASADRVPRD